MRASNCAICGHALYENEGVREGKDASHLFCYIVADSAKVGLPGFAPALKLLKGGRTHNEVRQFIKEGNK